ATAAAPACGSRRTSRPAIAPRSADTRTADSPPIAPSSASPDPSHRPTRRPRTAACSAADPPPGTLDAPMPPSPLAGARRIADDGPGSVVSLQRFFQQLLVQLKVRHNLLQPPVLLLQLLQPPNLIGLGSPVLLLPPE